MQSLTEMQAKYNDLKNSARNNQVVDEDNTLPINK